MQKLTTLVLLSALTAPSLMANTTESYYRHLMFRESPYSEYKGIYPLDNNSNPEFAHYEFTHDEQGRITQIAYKNGEDLIHNNLVWDSFIWFAPKVKIQYEQYQEIHTYYNSRDEQIAAHGNVYRAIYELDKNGKRISLTFYDQEGKASESQWNINRYQWHTTNEGFVREKRFNLNNEQQRFRPNLEFYEVQLEYDDEGKLEFMRNLGLEGKLTNNTSGAAVDRVTYDLDGNFIRWQVYDKDDNAVEGNSPMVHLGEHLYDDLGNKIGFRGYDSKGKQIAFSWGTYEEKRRYDEFGNTIEHFGYGPDGTQAFHITLDYSTTGKRLENFKSFDTQGKLTPTPMLGGAAMVSYDYAPDGSRKVNMLNPDLTPYSPPPPQQDSE